MSLNAILMALHSFFRMQQTYYAINFTCKKNREIQWTFLSRCSEVVHTTRFLTINWYDFIRTEQASLIISQPIEQNIVERTGAKLASTTNYPSKERESSFGTYFGMMIHAKTRNKRVMKWSRVMELSTNFANGLTLCGMSKSKIRLNH